MDAIIDYRGKTPKKTDSGIPLITAKIIKNGRIQEVNEFIAEGDYDSWMRRGIPKAGDIVLTTEAPLGEVAQLDDRRIALAQRVITLRGKKGLLNNDYLKYLLQSNDIQHQLDGRGTGTTVKGIKQSELREVILKFPDLPVQESVAFILKTLDGKIENNRRTNQTLELMAQTLFKSWFVDFDPVIDNALAAGNLIPVELQERAELRKRVIAERTTTPKLKPLPDDIQQLFPSKFEHCGNNSMGIAGWTLVERLLA
jgi:type I restriction enzyme S subunit